MQRHGPLPKMGPPGHHPMVQSPPPEHWEAKIVSQEAQKERLIGDNHRLAATLVALREELAAAQLEIQKLRAHTRSTHTESDIQMRILLDRIAEMEVNVRSGENVKKDVQQARMEAQNLVTSVQDLVARIQLASEELDKAHFVIEKLPEMQAEFDSLRQEHQSLRTTFEYEKGLNIEMVDQMQAMEKNLVNMVREVEKLRAELLKADKRARDPLYQPPMHRSGAYAMGYGRPHDQKVVETAGEEKLPHGIGNSAAASGDVGRAPIPTAGSPSVQGGAYDAPVSRR